MPVAIADLKELSEAAEKASQVAVAEVPTDYLATCELTSIK